MTTENKMTTENLEESQHRRFRELSAEVRSAADYVMNPSPPKRWIIDGWWPEKAKGMITGAPKTLKTHTALDLAVSLTHGVQFLGQFKVNVAPMPVIYFNEELDDNELEDDLTNIMANRGVLSPAEWEVDNDSETGESIASVVEEQKLNHPDEFSDWGWVNRKTPDSVPARFDIVTQAGFNLFGDFDWLVKQIAETGYQYVIFDPLYKLVGHADLKDDVAVRSAITMLDRLKKDTDCVPIVVHHHNRQNTFFGSVFWEAWHQCWWEFDERSADPKRIAVEVRTRGFKNPGPHGIELRGKGQWDLFDPSQDQRSAAREERETDVATVMEAEENADIVDQARRPRGRAAAVRMLKQRFPIEFGTVADKTIDRAVRNWAEST